ncbi:hypothetical protein [Synechococcus lacustris]|uniref:Uncharacterized protein n=1 Tax=Synechococcus lacustris str. Tous TaxID=1910958 RepID=A0A2P7EIA5_9SYNE|nr:hypothetical protein [Synechococcus lacustris]PSI02923.1 hypothetical protein C7K08_00665 [Synechococcus lacustris str. Tous]
MVDPIAVETVSPEPSASELLETIQELSSYRDRLRNDVVTLGQKLRLPKAKVDASLADHPELQRIEAILSQLQSQAQLG